MKKRSLILSAALLISAAASAHAAITVKDPAGTVVAVVDGDQIKPDAASPAKFVVADNEVKTPGGDVVIHIDGDMIRNKTGGDLLMYVDGRNIRRAPGGPILYYNDSTNLLPNRAGKPLFHIEGGELDSIHRSGMLYMVSPELFNVAPGADAAMLDARAKAAAAADVDTAKNFGTGKFEITFYQSNDPSNYVGSVNIQKLGDVYDLEFATKGGPALQGVGIKHGDEIWVALGPPATVGLAVYTVSGGNLTGTWYNVTGKPESFGSEKANGADPLGGAYTITEAKAPMTQAPYTGTVTLTSVDKKLNRDAPLYTLAWDLGGYKAAGIGFSSAGSLAAATSVGGEAAIWRLKMDPKAGTLTGESYSQSGKPAAWILKIKQ